MIAEMMMMDLVWAFLLSLVWGLVSMMMMSGSLLRSKEAGRRGVEIRRKISETDMRSRPKCACCNTPFSLGDLKVSVVNLRGDGTVIKGSAFTRWVALDCAVRHGFIPAKQQGRGGVVKVWKSLIDYPTTLLEQPDFNRLMATDDYEVVGEATPATSGDSEVDSTPTPTPEFSTPSVPQVDGDVSDSLAGVLGPHLLPYLQHQLIGAFNDKISAHEEQVMQSVASRIAELTLPRELTISTLEEPDEIEVGHTHSLFDRLLRASRTFIKPNQRMNILMTGEAGSGKTFASEQIFNVLLKLAESAGGFAPSVTEANFTVVSCHNEMMPSDIVGPMIPAIGGEDGKFTYCPTDLVRIYEEGGVVVIDEFDRLTAGTAVALNAAIAGTSWVLPDGSCIKRSKDFVLVATSNTFGNGRDGKYAGAQKLDAATLNRFAGGIIRWNYDSALEAVLCPIAELRDRIVGFREPMANSRIQRIISPRHLQAAFAAVTQHGLSHDEAIAEVFSEWSESDLRAIGMPSEVTGIILGGGV